jgi:hypothetical protein
MHIDPTKGRSNAHMQLQYIHGAGMLQYIHDAGIHMQKLQRKRNADTDVQSSPIPL